MVRFTVLASGSRGNSAIITCASATGGSTRILVDAGLSCRELFRRMRLANEDPATLDAILITHEHIDHIAGLAVTARKLGIPVYFTEATHRAWIRCVSPQRRLTYAQWAAQYRAQRDHPANPQPPACDSEANCAALQAHGFSPAEQAEKALKAHGFSPAVQAEKALQGHGFSPAVQADEALKGHGFSPAVQAEKALQGHGFSPAVQAEKALKGHGFSRAEQAESDSGALAPEACSPSDSAELSPKVLAEPHAPAPPLHSDLPNVQYFRSGEPFAIGDIRISPFTIPHDAADPVGFVFTADGVRLAVATDLGYITPNVQAQLRRCDLILLESNHDLDMLRDGPYPWSVKQRVLSRVGHLSNDATAAFLEGTYDGSATYLILAHLSESNNLPELARLSAERALAGRPSLLANRLLLATQDAPLEPVCF